VEERDVFDLPLEHVQRQLGDTQRLYAAELENYLVNRATGPAVTWDRDYGGVEAYLVSSRWTKTTSSCPDGCPSSATAISSRSSVRGRSRSRRGRKT